MKSSEKHKIIIFLPTKKRKNKKQKIFAEAPKIRKKQSAMSKDGTTKGNTIPIAFSFFTLERAKPTTINEIFPFAPTHIYTSNVQRKK